MAQKTSPQTSHVRILVRGKGTTLAERCLLADSLLRRLVGLLDRDRLNDGEALLLEPCKQVHMFFMRFPIDCVFLSPENRVVAIEAELKPWRVSRLHWHARRTLELPAGTCRRAGLLEGDELELLPC